MVASRRFSMLIASMVALPAGAANVFPYEQVGVYGSNNVFDSTTGACDTAFLDAGASFGCWDQKGQLCSNDPTAECDLAVVPKGRCAAGDSADCTWPGGAGNCVAGGGDPAYVGNIPCLTDAYLDPNDGSTATGPSSMCPNGGNCDMTPVPGGNFDPLCACDGSLANPNDPTLGEFTVCGGAFARCSDGDPTRAVGGRGLALCVQINTTAVATPAACTVPGRGLSSPNYDAFETVPFQNYPQRRPGEGFSISPSGPILQNRTTMAILFEPTSIMTDPNNFDGGVTRNFEVQGSSF
jgi:hypothetical protein